MSTGSSLAASLTWRRGAAAIKRMSELFRRVRRLDPESGGRIPAIALTAHASSEDRTKALRAGFQAHIAKPVSPRELVATIVSLAGLVGARAASRDQLG